MESIQKERRLNGDVIDRISDLPDPILCKILSFLPTKYALATATLSTRWKSLFPFWVYPIVLDLDDSLLLRPIKNRSHPSVDSKFIDFVDKLLNKALFDFTSVQILNLSCKANYGDDKMISWVNAALALNVTELFLKVRLYEYKFQKLFFQIINGCAALTKLELGRYFCLRLPDDFILPKLKSLVLDGVDAYHFNNLIDGCPILENLCLRRCGVISCGNIRIRSHSLRNLTIKNSWHGCWNDLIIDAPNLEVLVYDDCAASISSVSQFYCLLRAHIGVAPNEVEPIQYYYGNEEEEYEDEEEEEEEEDRWSGCALKLLNACSSTVYLYLSDDTIDDLCMSSLQLPAFPRLNYLSLGCVWRAEGWALLAHLLSNAPNLEKLTIEEGLSKCYGGYSFFESSLPSPPICLERCVKEIEFWVLKEEDDEVKLIEYFLKHGKVIQKIGLHYLPGNKSSFLSRLRMLPQQSKIDFQPR